MTDHCVYIGDDTGRKEGDQMVHACRLHEQCVLGASNSSMMPGCDGCKDRLALDDPKFADRWLDPLIVTDRQRAHTDALRNLLAGGSVFLVGGGPSANDQPLEELNRRGVWSLGINNMAGHSRFRPQAFVCSDPPKKFTSSVWLDPGIMKLVPIPKLRGRRGALRRKLPSGEFEKLKQRACDCPNTWGFKRNTYLTPDDDFFLIDGAMWGNHRAGSERTGEPRTVCTMLLGLRLLRYLGARRVFLVGCDFRMGAGYGYSFAQGRTEGACESNNRQFEIVGNWISTLQERGVFRRFGLEVFNCFKFSGLRAFPHAPFADAVADCKGLVEDAPDLSNWYEK